MAETKTNRETPIETALFQNEAMIQIINSVTMMGCGHTEVVAFIGSILGAQHVVLTRQRHRELASDREVCILSGEQAGDRC